MNSFSRIRDPLMIALRKLCVVYASTLLYLPAGPRDRAMSSGLECRMRVANSKRQLGLASSSAQIPCMRTALLRCCGGARKAALLITHAKVPPTVQNMLVAWYPHYMSPISPRQYKCGMYPHVLEDLREC